MDFHGITGYRATTLKSALDDHAGSAMRGGEMDEDIAAPTGDHRFPGCRECDESGSAVKAMDMDDIVATDDFP
jgi:hypothetical protein